MNADELKGYIIGATQRLVVSGDADDGVTIGDYIVTLGEGNILTDYYLNNKSKIVVDFCFTTKSPTQQRIFGVPSNGGITICVYINGSGYYAYNCNTAENWISMKKFTAGTRNTITMDILNGYMYIDSSAYKMTKYSGEFLTSIPLCICGWYQSDGTLKVHDHNARAKLYSLKVFEDEKLVRDYVPAMYKKKIGVYDNLRGNFFEYKSTQSYMVNE